MILIYISYIMYKNIFGVMAKGKGVGCYKVPTGNRNF